jgi:hypothetical protein
MTCRGCHTPHQTTNITLVSQQITPPALTGPQTAKPVVFLNKSGYAASSYASSTNNGPCQVCHTRTSYYLSDGTQTTHNPTGDCASCHKHGKGFAAVCTDCHGDETRTKSATVTGTVDTRFTASPPKDTAGLLTGVKVGAHLPHVNQGTYRTNALLCADCHPSPNTHQGTRDAAWSTTATGAARSSRRLPRAPAPAQRGKGPRRANWCHGTGLAGGGGTITSPNWTLGSGQGACGTCHRSPRRSM